MQNISKLNLMKESLLIFGGGPLQLSIIGVAKDMGFNAIVLDPDPNAPGKEIANEFYAVAGDDFDKTLQIAKKRHVKGIVTAATDKPILMMCNIAKELNLLFPSYESCDTLLDKAKFKEFLKLNNLPHAKGIELKGNYLPNQFDIACPLIVKPVTNSGSRGVIKVENFEKLPEAIAETLKHTKDERYLIEEYIEGDEISVEALVQNGIVHIIQITDKVVSEPPYNVELAHIQPSKYSYLKGEINELLQIIVDKAGLDNCALHPELKINNDKITIIEIGPRLGGDFITSDLVPLSTGVNIEKLVIKLATGEALNILTKNLAAIVSFFNLPAGSVLADEVNIDKLIVEYPNLISGSFSLEKGDKIPLITNSLDRFGFYILHSENIDILLMNKHEIEKYLTSLIKIYV